MSGGAYKLPPGLWRSSASKTDRHSPSVATLALAITVTMPSPRYIRALYRAIRLARLSEAWVPREHQRRPIEVVAYGSLVFNRRLAEATARLRGEADYEARILLRTMLDEVQVNYSWIRLRHIHSRANRFVKYLPIEQLKIMEEMPVDWRDSTYPQEVRKLRLARSRVGYLFRKQNPKTGKSYWASSWASVSSFQARLMEVLRHEEPGVDPPDTFLYAVYRWTSSSVHGGPHALRELLSLTAQGYRPNPRPAALRADSSIITALTILSATLSTAGTDLRFGETLVDRINALGTLVNKLRPPIALGT